jgi:hypothetical protein
LLLHILAQMPLSFCECWRNFLMGVCVCACVGGRSGILFFILAANFWKWFPHV